MNIRRIFKNRNLFRIINSSIKDHKDIFLKNRRIYRSSNQTDKLRNSKAKPSKSNKKKKERKLPLQNFHRQILIKFFDTEDILFSLLSSYRNKRMEETRDRAWSDDKDRRVDFLKREGKGGGIVVEG